MLTPAHAVVDVVDEVVVVVTDRISGAQITFGRGSVLDGCFCADRGKSDKEILLQCTEP